MGDLSFYRLFITPGAGPCAGELSGGRWSQEPWVKGRPLFRTSSNNHIFSEHRWGCCSERSGVFKTFCCFWHLCWSGISSQSFLPFPQYFFPLKKFLECLLPSIESSWVQGTSGTFSYPPHSCGCLHSSACSSAGNVFSVHSLLSHIILRPQTIWNVLLWQLQNAMML